MGEHVNREPNLAGLTKLHMTVTGHGLSRGEEGTFPPGTEIRFYVKDGQILPVATAVWMWKKLVRTGSDEYPGAEEYLDTPDMRGILSHVFFEGAKMSPLWVTEATDEKDGFSSGVYIHHTGDSAPPTSQPPHYCKWRELREFTCFDGSYRSVPLAGICAEIKALARASGHRGLVVIHFLTCREK